MNYSHIGLLQCIKCKSSLLLSKKYKCQLRSDNIETGVLTCIKCGSSYPIINGVGVFFSEELFRHYLNQHEEEVCKRLGLNYSFDTEDINEEWKKQLDVAKNWSYQWNEVFNYSKEELEQQGFFSEELFFKFIPIQPSKLNDTNVVVWCGGKGREAYHIFKHRPKLLVVNEIGDEIYGIREIVSDNANLLLIRCDMTNNPLIEGFADYSICDHALQHVADHRLGYMKMLNVLKPGGIAAINVYSYENNFLMTHIIEPLKVIFHKLPISIQRIIAIMPAIIIYFLIHFFYVPAKKVFSHKFCKRLLLFDHMIFWSKDTFKFVWMACFDLIHAPISYHFKKSEIQELADSNKVDILKLINTHGTTWSMIIQK